MKKELISKILLFTTGATVGSVVTWVLLKTKYEKIANEEVESVREYYANKEKPESEQLSETDIEESNIDNSEESKNTYNNIIDKNNYSIKKENEEEEEEDMYKPEVIAPEESWECEYPTLSLVYYEGDGVLANDDNEIIDNVEELVGEDFASHFGEYEDDSVFIKNDKMGVYYEILRDYGCYSESN